MDSKVPILFGPPNLRHSDFGVWTKKIQKYTVYTIWISMYFIYVEKNRKNMWILAEYPMGE